MKRRYLFMCAVFLTVFMVVGCSKNVDQKESSVKIEEGENDSENEKNEAPSPSADLPDQIPDTDCDRTDSGNCIRP